MVNLFVPRPRCFCPPRSGPSGEQGMAAGLQLRLSNFARGLLHLTMYKLGSFFLHFHQFFFLIP